ncbi:GNAT family N-acetyltransferase [Candidatus Solirubrobacter pratensis]|uniref:GNAT family N-acetyltransferase n=1 Tax=Candidatus Solirubrobacter pratensis TaxID=1298857 RepID=UPI0004163536|nr:GNAT family N-acetyltransferase [Candidatus Solirubrobacter pratensis]
MRVEVRPLASLDAADVQRWRHLAATAAEPNPFYEPAFVYPAARNLTDHQTRLLIATDGDEWTACMPVVRSARFRKVPGPAVLNWVHTHCYLGTPLIAADRVTSAWRALLAHLLDKRTGFLALELLGEDGPVARGLTEALAELELGAVLYEQGERAALYRGEAGQVTLTSKRARELRRQRRQLEEAAGGNVQILDRASDAGAVEQFLALEASGWKGRAGTALSSAGHRAFFGEMARTFAADGRLQLLSLEVAGEPVAMKCNVIAGDGVFCFKIAHDETFARYSPGIQLERENADIFEKTPGVTWEDSCAWVHNQMINRLWRGRRRISTVLVPSAHELGRASRLAIRGALRARRGLGRQP